MKLNWAERWAVNNPLRVVQQRLEIGWMNRVWPLPPGGIFLEVGCGRGAGAGIILRTFRPARLHALDLDPQMIRRARGYLPSPIRREISFSAGDGCFLPCRPGLFDAVFGFGVLHHIPDWRRGLAEIARVLKPGGAYFLEELYPPLYQNFLTGRLLLHPRQDRFQSADLKESLKRAGLSLEKIRERKGLGILGVASKEKGSLSPCRRPPF